MSVCTPGSGSRRKRGVSPIVGSLVLFAMADGLSVCNTERIIAAVRGRR
ncbi:hypothetical protein Ga0100231_003575 [Opitutaceae bacterium TAV4]|nr:hypothetical protein Ga0100231_003575 [Opitutaceae bacterium TAV4]RRK02010.1 hypothetical protein Ga0100230_001995 [Opitutaceae bacterium TAV3]